MSRTTGYHNLCSPASKLRQLFNIPVIGSQIFHSSHIFTVGMVETRLASESCDRNDTAFRAIHVTLQYHNLQHNWIINLQNNGLNLQLILYFMTVQYMPFWPPAPSVWHMPIAKYMPGICQVWHMHIANLAGRCHQVSDFHINPSSCEVAFQTKLTNWQKIIIWLWQKIRVASKTLSITWSTSWSD